MSSSPDAVVVGAGPNGLAAAIVIAQAGRKVVLFEASESVGGGVRSAELTLPGFVHDVCSAVHPLAAGSPFFRTLPLASHGLEWIEPPAMLAHPLDDGSAVTIERSVTQTAANLVSDRRAYEEVIGSLVRRWPQIEMDVLGPLRWPRRPLMMAHFGRLALESAERFARRSFGHEPTRDLWAGIAAHSVLPLDFFATAGFGLVLTVLAHTSGWLIPRGGAQRIANALAAYFESLGGTIVTHAEIKSLEDLPAAPATLFDLSPKPLLRIAGRRFPDWYRRRLEQYRYGMGVYKVDWALHAPIPWRASACARAGTVHLGGTIDEIAHSERQTFEGQVPDRPLIIVAQPTLFDPGRAPAGCHTAWTYCHVPHGSTVDMLPRLEGQIERFAPGFRDRVLARSITTPADLERNNPNMVGGDIASGANDIRQLFSRPTWRTYSTPVRGWYICSASTPPGGGVHGMCGYFAAHRALAEVLR